MKTPIKTMRIPRGLLHSMMATNADAWEAQVRRSLAERIRAWWPAVYMTRRGVAQMENGQWRMEKRETGRIAS